MKNSIWAASYPIVKREKAHKLFIDLPILFIDDWSEIDECLLNEKFEEFSNRNWNFDKLKLSYWLDYITSIIDLKK